MNYEIGYKARLLGGRLLIDADVFYMDYEDIQQSDQDGAGFFISNAATARGYGLELQTQWLLASSTFLNVGVGYVDARKREFGDRSVHAMPRAPRIPGSFSLYLITDPATGWSVQTQEMA